jgi:hypothetical protein
MCPPSRRRRDIEVDGHDEQQHDPRDHGWSGEQGGVRQAHGEVRAP